MWIEININECLHILIDCSQLCKTYCNVLFGSFTRDRHARRHIYRRTLGNNIKCVVHDDLGWKKRTTRYILPRHWLYEWFSQFHGCGTYLFLSQSPSTYILKLKLYAMPVGNHTQISVILNSTQHKSRRKKLQRAYINPWSLKKQSINFILKITVFCQLVTHAVNYSMHLLL